MNWRWCVEMIGKWILLFLFSIIISGRGIMIKILHIANINLPEILFLGGLYSAILTVIFQIITKQKIYSHHILKLQIIRFFISYIFWPLAFYSFIKLDVSVVNTISKLTIPIFILLGGYLGTSYNKKDKNYATISIVLLLLFFIIHYTQKPQPIEYAIFALAIAVVMLETFLLRNTCKLYSAFDVILIPSIACCFSGLTLMQFGHFDYSILFELTLRSNLLIFVFSLLFFLHYLSSIFKYEIFPLGVSEYPLLLAIYPTLLWEYLYLRHQIDSISLLLIISITLLLARCVKTNHEFSTSPKLFKMFKLVSQRN